MKWFDPCLLLNEQLVVLMVQKQGYTAALDQLTSELLSEHQNVLDCVKGLRDQRDELNQEIRARQQGQCFRV